MIVFVVSPPPQYSHINSFSVVQCLIYYIYSSQWLKCYQINNGGWPCRENSCTAAVASHKHVFRSAGQLQWQRLRQLYGKLVLWFSSWELKANLWAHSSLTFPLPICCCFKVSRCSYPKSPQSSIHCDHRAHHLIGSLSSLKTALADLPGFFYICTGTIGDMY